MTEIQFMKTTREELLKVLSTVTGVAEKRHVVPILSHLLLRKRGLLVSIIATDLNIQVTTHADFGIGTEAVSILVAAHKLLDIVKSLPQSSSILFSLCEKKLDIQSGRSRFVIQTLAEDEFPVINQPEHWDISLDISQRDLRYLLNSVHFAMAKQDVRHYLNGTLLSFEPGHIRAVATDGHRLAHCSIPEKSIEKDDAVIIPRKTVIEIQRLLGDSNERVHVDAAPGKIRFTFFDIELVSKLVEGKFPDFKRVIPLDCTLHFVVSRQLFQASLLRASILTNEKFKGIRLRLTQDKIKISSANSELEAAQEEIDINYSGEHLDIGFNVIYLLDLLSKVKSNEIKFSITQGSKKSALITLPEDEQFKYVVMPMRV